MIMSYILVYQHNNVIYWSLKQLNMFLFLKKKSYNNGIAREARRKFLVRGGDKSAHGGGLKIFWMGGGQLLMGGDYPFKRGGVPHPPP